MPTTGIWWEPCKHFYTVFLAKVRCSGHRSCLTISTVFGQGQVHWPQKLLSNFYSFFWVKVKFTDHRNIPTFLYSCFGQLILHFCPLIIHFISRVFKNHLSALVGSTAIISLFSDDTDDAVRQHDDVPVPVPRGHPGGGGALRQAGVRHGGGRTGQERPRHQRLSHIFKIIIIFAKGVSDLESKTSKKKMMLFTIFGYLRSFWQQHCVMHLATYF